MRSTRWRVGPVPRGAGPVGPRVGTGTSAPSGAHVRGITSLEPTFTRSEQGMERVPGSALLH